MSEAKTQSFWLFASQVVSLVKTHRGRYALGSVFMLLSLGTTLYYPWLLRIIVDEGIEGGRMDLVNDIAVIMGFVLIVQAGATYAHTYLYELAAVRVRTQLQNSIYRKLLFQDTNFYDHHTVGNITGRLAADTAVLVVLLSHTIPETIRFVITGTVGLGMMFYISPLLSGVVILVGPPIYLGAMVLGRVLRKDTVHVQTDNARVLETSVETLTAAQTVKLYHQEEAEAERYAQHNVRVVAAVKKQTRTHAALESFTSFVSEGGVVVAIWFGGMLIVGGELTAGTLIPFILYAGMVTRALRNASSLSAEFLRAQGATERIFEISRIEPTMGMEGGLSPTSCDGHVRLENVSFTYPSRPESAAVHNIDLEIRSGETVALVGTSGCGKSTVVKLIARLYDPDSGAVTLDGHDLRDLNLPWLRQQVTLVPAEAALFNRTLGDNIRYGNDEADDKAVEEAARIAKADEFIWDSEEGLDAMPGDRGTRYSSGQRQRVAIARAILRQPKLLILDEATGALDSELETLVKAGIAGLDYKPTVIIVAHRLSAVVDVDRVILLDAGRVIDSGTHFDLLARSTPYRELMEDQLLSG